MTEADGTGSQQFKTAGGVMYEAAEEQVETEVFFGATGEMGDINLSETAPEPGEILTEEEISIPFDEAPLCVSSHCCASCAPTRPVYLLCASVR